MAIYNYLYEKLQTSSNTHFPQMTMYILALLCSTIDQDILLPHFFKAIPPEYAPDPSPPTTPLGILQKIKRVRQATVARLQTVSAKRASFDTRPLRIAVCVTGQLRGYKEAFPTWKHFRFEGCHVDYFVHTWKNIGRRFPDPGQAHRCFTGNFLKSFQAIPNFSNPDWFKTYYPNFSQQIAAPCEATLPDLEQLYASKNITIDDDQSGIFETFPIAKKMYYKLYKCYSIVKRTKQHYDLIIKIRPDFVLKEPMTLDWHKIYHDSLHDYCIYCDSGRFVERGPVSPMYAIGDNIAIGGMAPMTSYCCSYIHTKSQMRWKHSFGFIDRFVPHANQAYATFYRGVHVKPLIFPQSGWSVQENYLSAREIYTALQRDCAARQAIPEDDILLNACEMDF